MKSSYQKYHRVYIEHYGPIPLDEEGRSYDIHHIDGNHKNNDPKNLKAVTIQEHYDIHYAQGDWYACGMISLRMKISPEEKSELARKQQLERVKNGIHNWRKGASTAQTIEQRIEIQRKRVVDGTHNWLGPENNLKRVAEGTNPFSGPENNTKRLANGTHNFLHQIANGTHPAQKIHTCPHCKKVGKGGGMSRWHFDNCKAKK